MFLTIYMHLYGIVETVLYVFYEAMYVQNMAAKVPLKRGKYTSSTDSLQTLHLVWLLLEILLKLFMCICMVHIYVTDVNVIFNKYGCQIKI